MPPSDRRLGERRMTRFSTKTLLTAAALAVAAALVVAAAPAALTTSAFAQAAAAPWELKPDMGYGYDKNGQTFSYKMGTNNAGLLLKGAKKVPKGTLFFIGQNGQLYIRTGPYLEGDGKFMFGTN
jgi:opacity protein-like surface antigen